MKRKKYIEHGDYDLLHVTDILGKVIGVDQGLLYWYGKIGNEEAKRVVNASSLLGKDAHSIFEYWFAKDRDFNAVYHAEYENRLKQVEEHLIERGLCSVAGEVKIYFDKYGYGGTTDQIFVDNKGMHYIYDWKSGRKDRFKESMQLAAYAFAYEQETGNQVMGACDVYIGKNDDVTVDFEEYDRAELEKAWDMFRKVIDLHTYKTTINKSRGRKSGKR